MRVIAGKFKGRQLFSPKDEAVRPTTDRIKENIFNLIQFRVSGARFLDLFGGSGAMSVEAVSRGAMRVVTVDHARDSLALIKKNFEKVGIGKEGQIMDADYAVAIERLKGDPFDIIFCDPPYHAGFYEDILRKIGEKELLSDGGILVFEHATEREIPLTDGWEALDCRKYGSVTVDILTFRKSAKS